MWWINETTETYVILAILLFLMPLDHMKLIIYYITCIFFSFIAYTHRRVFVCIINILKITRILVLILDWETNVLSTQVSEIFATSPMSIFCYILKLYIWTCSIWMYHSKTMLLEKRKNRKNILIYICQKVTPSASSGYIFKFCTSMLWKIHIVR